MKKMNWKLFLLSLLACLNLGNSHPSDIRSKLLTKEDLALEAPRLVPFLEIDGRKEQAAWHCFEVEDPYVDCDPSGLREAERRIRKPFRLVVSFEDHSHLYTFATDNMTQRVCESHRRDLVLAFKNQESICFFGAYLQEIPFEPQGGLRRSSYWVFERLKSEHYSWRNEDL